MKPSEAVEYIWSLPEAQVEGYDWTVGFEDNAGELVVVLWVNKNKGFRHLIGCPNESYTYERALRDVVGELLGQAERWQKMLSDHEGGPAKKGGHRDTS